MRHHLVHVLNAGRRPVRPIWLIGLLLALLAAGCAGEPMPATDTTPPPASTEPGPSTSTDGSATTSIPSPVTTTTAPTTVASTTSTTAAFYVEEIEDDWTLTPIGWGIRPACCDQPAVGPVSPEGSIPEEGWPADGFYDVTATRVDETPGVLRVTLRRWVPCAQLPDRCPPVEDGIVSDPATEVMKILSMDDDLTVVIRPIQPASGGSPEMGITGSGRALYELLSGFCGGYLPSPLPINCGVDHAFIDWVRDPYRRGVPLDEITQEIVIRSTDPAFPLGPFDDQSSDTPCSADRSCPIAYRGPHDTHLVVTPGLIQSGWPGLDLYGWWVSLEIRDGRPILYIDAGQIAG